LGKSRSRIAGLVKSAFLSPPEPRTRYEMLSEIHYSGNGR
jgi:hypothetical protein